MSKDEKVQNVLLSDIFVDPSWNARSSLESGGGGPDGGEGFKGLKQSIAVKGQDEPVFVRKNPTKSKHPYALVAGFRRYEAISQLGHERGEKTPTIKTIVRELDERSARELNLRENTARDDLSGADLAFGIHDMYKNQPDLTDTAVADMLGMSQGYVSKLNRIMRNVKPTIVADWRKATLKLTVDQVASLIELPKDEQQEKYDDLVRGKEKKGDRGPNSWVSTCKKHAASVARTLAKLAHEKVVTVNGPLYDHVHHFVSIKKTATDKQQDSIRSAADEAFQDETLKLVTPKPVEEPKKRGRKPAAVVEENGATVEAVQ